MREHVENRCIYVQWIGGCGHDEIINDKRRHLCQRIVLFDTRLVYERVRLHRRL